MKATNYIAWSLLGLALLAASASAQVVVTTGPVSEARREGIRPEGLILEVGAVAPTHGDRGFLFGVQAPMGTLLSRHLDLTIGLRRWSADIDRSEFGGTTEGSFSATSLNAVLAYPLFAMKGLRPYVGAGLAGHAAGADIPGDPSLADALDGTKFGSLAVVGIATTRPGLGVRLQARRDFVEDIGGWSYSLGIGWWPKTRAARSLDSAYGDNSAPAGQVPLMASPAAAAPPPSAAAAATVEGPGTTSQADLVRALNHLKAQNEDLAAELSDLRRQVASAERPAPVPTPVPEPVQVREPIADRLFGALAAVVGERALRRDGQTALLTLDQSLLFAPGQSALTVTAREHLRRIGVVLLRHPGARVEVQGHTDATGTPAGNLRLSDLRARAVRDELLGVGIAPAHLHAIGYGDSRPVATNETADGRARNRRVDLFVTTVDNGSN